ncbi:hypothetical protein DL764_002837 [Monosporascus ibericus]|uniref:Uncharacterized protein n=1 Tax=Monosporascus ibericus TaxID=155417 RepID=A0A4Q4TN09_9PEZI|nr:hypothetical protein DL764_002837 [Monosporascus ibericus]
MSTAKRARGPPDDHFGFGEDLKWIWFAQGPHKLVDLKTFDGASRGVFGALVLLLSHTGHFATFGAVAIVLRIGFDPFIQNLVHFQPGTLLDEGSAAVVGRISISNETGISRAFAMTGVSQRIKANAVYQSIRADLDTSAFGQGGQYLRNNTPFEATECVLQPCVLSLTASVTQGQYSEQVLATYVQPPSEDWMCGFDVLQPPWGAEQGMQPNETFGFADWQMCSATMDLPTSLIVGKVSTFDNNYGLISESSTNGINGDGVEAIFYSNVTGLTYSDCEEPRNGFSCVFQSVGRGIAKAVRDTSFAFTNNNATGWAIGESLTTVFFIRVEWQWLLLPLAVWLLSCVTLAGAIWKTRRAGWPVWRDDPLPLVFMQRYDDMIEQLSKRFGGVSTLAHEMRAKNPVVRLENNHDRVSLKRLK